ncbi:MAG: hypothetical protein IJO64_04000 [Clostridia bacterium]|nr:hypothetical protein [Clostridia bacterium]
MLSTKNDMKRICKKLLCVVFALSTLLSVSSCEELDSFHGELEWVESGDSEEKMLLYKENFYYYAHDWVEICDYDRESVIEIGWRYRLPFPNAYYYVLSEDDPQFIFCGDSGNISHYGIYFKEGYSYADKTYYIPETDIEVVLSDAITSDWVEELEFDTTSGKSFSMYMKSDPRFTVCVSFAYRKGEDWYIYKDQKYWRLDKAFAAELIENGILAERELSV